MVRFYKQGFIDKIQQENALKIQKIMKFRGSKYIGFFDILTSLW